MMIFLSFTDRGKALADRISAFFPDEKKKFYTRSGSASKFVDKYFRQADKVVFVGAVGIAVRLIAPHALKKDVDPAVVCVDETGRFAIPILSGHIGGANELAEKISTQIGCQSVITTATDISGVFAWDVWARKNDCKVANTAEIKHISATLLKGEKVGFVSDFEVRGELPEGTFAEIHSLDSAEVKTGASQTERIRDGGLQAEEKENAGKIGICISLDENKKPFRHTLNLIPRVIVLGVGCRRDTDSELFEKFICDSLEDLGISIKAVSGIASVDIKKDEECIKRFGKKYGIEPVFFSPEKLMNVKGSFSASKFVKQVTGADNVCERSAAAAGAIEFMMRKKSRDGMTLAIGKKKAKFLFRQDVQMGDV